MRFKKYLIGLIAICSAFIFIPKIKAENKCITYENYYFFVAVNNKSYLEMCLQNNEKFNFMTYDYFPKPDVAINNGHQSVSVCLRKNSTDNRCDGKQEIRDLSWFYDNYSKTAGSSNQRTVEVNATEYTSSAPAKIYTESDTTNNVVRTFYTHGKWFEVDSSGRVEEHNDGKNILNADLSKLVNASVLPTKSEMETNWILMSPSDGNSYVLGNIKRYLTLPAVGSSDYPNFYGIKWNEGDTTDTDVWLLPQLGLIRYEVCTEVNDKGEPVLYKAQIDYVYDDGSKAADSYFAENLPNDYTTPVESPVINGCSADKNSVVVTIDKDNPEHFHDTVTYTCSGSHPTTPSKDKTNNEITTNGKTGDALIYVAWFVGLAAIGFVVYYYFKERKAKSEL